MPDCLSSFLDLPGFFLQHFSCEGAGGGSTSVSLVVYPDEF